MQRWNGWGDESVHVALPEEGSRLLQRLVGEGRPRSDCKRESLLQRIPASRLPPHPCIQSDHHCRLDHSHGQSLPDWIGLRAGTLHHFPDGVAFPKSCEEVQTLMRFCRERRITVIAFGGGTSVAGQLQVPDEDRPVLSISLQRLNQMVGLSPSELLATFEAGISGEALEKALQNRGFTLGHFFPLLA